MEITQSPYVVGNTLHLQLRDEQAHPQIDATITRIITPFTLSCVAEVTISSFGLAAIPQGTRAILKLFDRRFASQIREEDNGLKPWTSGVENDYRKYLFEDETASSFIARLETEGLPFIYEERGTFTTVQEEVYLQYKMFRFFNAELEVYRRIQDLQGTDVPKVLVTVTLSDDSGTKHKYLECPGLLLEFIEGIPLSDIDTSIPREAWQDLCEDAIRIVHTISDRDIRNEDVKPRNFIVRKEGDKYKAIMIDFALCVFKKSDEELSEWREAQASQDEEGAVGYVMARKLGDGFRYTRSEKYNKLDFEFKGEDV
jgi:hypothetical protein